MAADAHLDVDGCILGGAIGDAFGGVEERGCLCLSDDTQLTLATCEAIVKAERVDPAQVAETFRLWFADRRLSGLGSSTLKALRDLQVGAHWALAGAQGEMAAGNGGAMRIAPLGFVLDAESDRKTVRDVVWVTHRNDEAYLGALAVLLALQRPWPATPSALLLAIADGLPDSRVRDRLVAVGQSGLANDLGRLGTEFGTSGYVVDTVPLAICAGWLMVSRGFAPVLAEVCQVGGDSDTIGAIAGQLSGARLGAAALPQDLLTQLTERSWVADISERFRRFVARRLTRG